MNAPPVKGDGRGVATVRVKKQDGNGHLTEVMFADGRTERYQPDGGGTVKYTSSAGQITRWQRDGQWAGAQADGCDGSQDLWASTTLTALSFRTTLTNENGKATGSAGTMPFWTGDGTDGPHAAAVGYGYNAR